MKISSIIICLFLLTGNLFAQSSSVKAGEAPEWETAEYVRDAVAAGMNKAIIFLGHVISEEPGMEYCAEWLKAFITEVPVEFVPAVEPFWTPK